MANNSNTPLSLAIVLQQVGLERNRQDEKWGVQDHPDVRPGESSADYRMAAQLEREDATVVNEDNADTGENNWKDILDEEVKEAYYEAHCGNESLLREELIQVAAVTAAWIEALDRRVAARTAEPATNSEG